MATVVIPAILGLVSRAGRQQPTIRPCQRIATVHGALHLSFTCRHATGEPIQKTKKADVVKRPKAFHHVGLLFNELPGMAERLFI
jgi:hypothetical protein